MVDDGAAMRGGSQSALRERNIRAVLAGIASGPVSLQALSRRTRLARGTVWNAIEFLRGILIEESSRQVQGPGGRATTTYRFADDLGFAVGVDFDHDSVRVGICGLDGKLQWSKASHEGFAAAEHLAVDEHPEQAMALAAQMITAGLAVLGLTPASEKLLGIGLGVAGPVDPLTGAISPRVLPAWRGDPRQLLRNQLALAASTPVLVENDANCAALAEFEMGAGQNPPGPNVLYVKTAAGPAGVGGGVITHAALYHGAGHAGEIGHMVIEPGATDQVCPHCGHSGCLETTMSTPTLVSKTDRESAGFLDDIGWRDVVLAAYAERDRGADPRPFSAAVARAGELMGRALACAMAILHPDLVILGGPLAEAWSAMSAGTPDGKRLWPTDPVRDGIQTFSLVESADIRTGQLGNWAVAQGAGASILRELKYDYLMRLAEARFSLSA